MFAFFNVLMAKLAVLNFIGAKVVEYRSVVGPVAVVLAMVALSLLAVNLPSATQRVHFVVALGLVSFFAGFLSPRF